MKRHSDASLHLDSRRRIEHRKRKSDRFAIRRRHSLQPICTGSRDFQNRSTSARLIGGGWLWSSVSEPTVLPGLTPFDPGHPMLQICWLRSNRRQSEFRRG